MWVAIEPDLQDMNNCNQFQKTWHYEYKSSAPSAAPRRTARDIIVAAKKSWGACLTLFRFRNNEEDRQKNDRGQY